MILLIKTLFQFMSGIVLILFCYWGGSWIKHSLGLIIPANVIGLFILLGLLALGWIQVEWIEKAVSFLLLLLPFFFVPVFVMAGQNKTLWIKHGWSVAFILIVGVGIQWWVIGRMTSWLLKRPSLHRDTSSA